MSSTSSRARLPSNFAPGPPHPGQSDARTVSSSSSTGYPDSPAMSSSAAFSAGGSAYGGGGGGGGSTADRSRQVSSSSTQQGGQARNGAMSDEERRRIAAVYFEELKDYLADFLKRGALFLTFTFRRCGRHAGQRLAVSRTSRWAQLVNQKLLLCSSSIVGPMLVVLRERSSLTVRFYLLRPHRAAQRAHQRAGEAHAVVQAPVSRAVDRRLRRVRSTTNRGPGSRCVVFSLSLSRESPLSLQALARTAGLIFLLRVLRFGCGRQFRSCPSSRSFIPSGTRRGRSSRA